MLHTAFCFWDVCTLLYKHYLGVDPGKHIVRVMLSHAGKSAAAGKNPPGNQSVPVRLTSTPTPQSVPLSAAAGWGAPGSQPPQPRPTSATPGHPPPSAGWGVPGSQPFPPRPTGATPGNPRPPAGWGNPDSQPLPPRPAGATPGHPPPPAGWGVPGSQPLSPRPAGATPARSAPSAGWGDPGSQPLPPRPAGATPGHPPPQRAGASLAASPSHLGQLVLLLGIPLLQLAGWGAQLQLAGMPMAATTSQANWSLWNGLASSRLRQSRLQLIGVPLAIKHFQPPQVPIPSSVSLRI